MRKRYRRRTAVGYGNSGHSLFGVTGWLFADLLLALALAFLLATTVGTPPKPTPRPPALPSTSSTHKAGTSRPKQSLELSPVHIAFTIDDPEDLATGSKAAVAAVRATIVQKTRGIKTRSAGIVLLFGGNESQDPTWQQVDMSIEKILKSLAGTSPLFYQQTRYVPFLNISDPGQFAMDVYLFNMTS